MASPTSPISGSTASLRPSGVARYSGVVFFVVWLAGCAVFVMVSVPGWLPICLLGGIVASAQLLRSIAGEDRIAVQPSGIDVVRRAGPFHRTYSFDRAAIRRVRIRHRDRALVIDTTSGARLLTQLGTPSERDAVAEWIREHVPLSHQSSSSDPGTLPAGWETARGRLTFRRRFLWWATEQSFTSAHLKVTHDIDSDGDHLYRLVVTDAHNRRTIYREMNDSGDIVDLARWLATATGFPLALPHGMEPPRTTPVTADEMRLGDS
jgi:hypothetical protein